jgi:hypothetical protein
MPEPTELALPSITPVAELGDDMPAQRVFVAGLFGLTG